MRDSGARARASLASLVASGVDCEVRTAVHPALLTAEDLARLDCDLAQCGVTRRRLQPFRSIGCVDAALIESAVPQAAPHEESLRRRKVAATAGGARPNAGALQFATQLAFLEASHVLNRLAKDAAGGSAETEKLARIGLANYFAGALLTPYGAFLSAAQSVHYDIDLLGERFGVVYETISHRLRSLQRLGAAGAPFFLVRVDRAGAI